jgi:hypothetical protein
MDDELSEWERGQLAQLPKEIEPPVGLRDRIAGRIGLKRRRGTMFLVTAAAVVAGFVAGMLMPRHEPVPRGKEFILFIHDTPSMRVDGNEPRRIEEYRHWAHELHAKGTMTAGEKLTGEVSSVGSNAGSSTVGGFFRIVARDRAEAERVARTCPHLRYGGWIEVREIDRV